MTIYDDMQGVAQDLFTEFKQGVIDYVKVTKGAGPIDNPGDATKTRYRINATVNGAGFKYVSMGLAQKSDLQMSMPVDPRFTPVAGDFVEIDGIPYKVGSIIAKPAAGTPVAYTIILARG